VGWYILDSKQNVHLNTRNRRQTSHLMRWTTVACLFLVFVLAGLEVTHAHSEIASVRSSPCAICLSVHANAPAATYHFFSTLLTVEAIPAAVETTAKDSSRKLSLFIRPPPSA
jgi:hypothetical protein